jgi:hypothetical protein
MSPVAFREPVESAVTFRPLLPMEVLAGEKP